MMDGRADLTSKDSWGSAMFVTTEHPKRASHEIEMIDLVVVNLYPFEDTVARANVTFEEAIEQIDIGGPSMLRAVLQKIIRCYGLRSF